MRPDERIDLPAQIRLREGEELLQPPLHPACLRDRDERIGPVADKGHVGVCGHAPGKIEAAPKRGPGRRKIPATEMAVDDGAKHRSIHGGAGCFGHGGIPDRNRGVEIPVERGAEGIADDRVGNRIGRCIVRRENRTDAGHDVPPVDGHLSFPQQHTRIRPPLPAGGLDPLPEGGGLMEDIERIDPLRYHLAAVGHQIARHRTAARRRATDNLAVGEIDLDHLRRVDGEEQPAVGDHPPTTRAGAGEDQRRGPARRSVGERDAVDATTADEDHAAIDDTGDIQPLLARLLPDDAPRPQIEAVDFLRLPWREDDPSSGNNRYAVAPPCRGRRSCGRAEDLAIDHHRSTEGVAPADPHAVLEHDRVSPLRARVVVGPEERPRGKIDCDGCAGPGRADEHPIAERRGEPSDPAEVAFTIADHAVVLELGQRLRPDDRSIGGGEDVETDLPALLDEDEQLITDRERSTEVPPARRGRDPLEPGLAGGGLRGLGGGEAPRQFTPCGDPVGGENIGPPGWRRESPEHAVDVVDGGTGKRGRITLHGKHQLAIAR